MRTVYDNTGADVTTNVAAQLATGSCTLIDLFWFQYVNPGDPNNGAAIKITNTYLSNAPFPLTVNKLQSQPGPLGVTTINATYLPGRLRRSAFSYEVGFGDQSVDLTWDIDDSVAFHNAPGYTIPWGFKWALVQGYLDETPIYVHRAFLTPPLLPTDKPTLIGTTLMWRGFVRDVKADRSQVIITLGSLMHMFQNTQVPTQVIVPGSRRPPYTPGTVTLFGNSLTGIVPLTTCTPTDLQFTLTTGYPADHQLRDAYFTSHQQPPPNGWNPTSAQPTPAVFRIRDNITNNTPVANTLHVYPYEPINPVTLVCIPNGLQQFLEIFFPQPLNTGSLGFPFVPPPEVSF